MLKSQRKFGVEVEFVAPSRKAFDSIAMSVDRITTDGSLRPLQWAGEWVSPILKGKVGERRVVEACDTLKNYGADCSNPQTSIHIHLDGQRDGGRSERSRSRDKESTRSIGISNALMKLLTEEQINSLLTGRNNLTIMPEHVRTDLDEVTYYSRGRLTRHPRMNYRYYHFYQSDRFNWLKNIFIFYTQYSDVMQAIVSRSRRRTNMYCQALSDSFDIQDIMEAQDINTLQAVWYKATGPGGNYNDSRYHEVNLDSYWGKHGTVEIRSHGGTTDANKILLWLRLHQHIADKLENMTPEQVLREFKEPKDVFISFLEFVSDDELLEEYVKRLLGYYSGIKITGDKVTGI